MSRRLSLAALLVSLLAVAPAHAESLTIRVLVQNIYGRRERDCEQRYQALAANILSARPAFDVVALNEHWKVPGDPWFTCDADVLTKALEADGRYAGAGHSIQHAPRTDGPLQVAGGDSIFTLHSIVDGYQAHFAHGRSFPLSGYVQARIQAAGAEFDFWDIHLESEGDGCDRACRKAALAEFGAAVDARPGRPVLIVGDFNIGGPLIASEKPPYAGNPGYGDILTALHQPRDLWLDAGRGGGGYTFDCAENHTQSCPERERIDYVFLPPAAADWYFVPKSVSIVKWTTPSGIEISDHYGLDATLELRHKETEAAAPPEASR